MYYTMKFWVKMENAISKNDIFENAKDIFVRDSKISIVNFIDEFCRPSS